MTTPEQAPPPADALAAGPAPLPAGFTAAPAPVNGIALHYVRGGSGPPVALLHGFPQT